jgi:tRNA G10  N-methylase Trm11
MKSLAILGRQPEIGLAELESLYGPESVQPLNGGACLINVLPKDIAFPRLGACMKLCKVVASLDTTEWFDIEKYLLKATKEHEQYVPDGKLTIGISVYGLQVTSKMLERTSLSIKKSLKSSGRPIRIVPNKSSELSTPQIIHNKLTSENGWEIVLYRNGNQTILAITTDIQDIESYTARDQARPMRDTRVGMLPPKLAQVIINFALSTTQAENSVVLDPFCGTGVVLQEASLMGFDVYGTDVEPRMIDYSTKNMFWLRDTFHANTNVRIEVGDATTFTWKQPVSTVACEGYLGLPFAHMPSDAQLQESIQTSNSIAKGFLRNLHSQLPENTRICIALPAWHIKDKVKHLPLLDQLTQLGWERVVFSHANHSQLIYRREDQIVGRELVVLTRV